MSRKKNDPGKRVTEAVNRMYAKMAEAAAKKAVALAGGDTTLDSQSRAEAVASYAEDWAKRAGGNAIRWGIV